MKLGKIMFLSLVSFISFDLTASHAWWWGLYPGAHVIDQSRLQRSIQITAQTLFTAQQTFQNYQNRLISLLPTTVFGEVNNTIKAVKSGEDEFFSSLLGPMNKNQQDINPLPGQYNDLSAWNVFLDPTDANLSATATSAQNAAMRTVQTNANYDAFTVIRAQNDNLKSIGTEINRLARVEESGNQGQRQIAIAQRTLITTMMMNNLYAEAAADIATETKTKADITKKIIAIRQMRYLPLGTYDPYRRTPQDNAVYPTTTAIGYPRF